MLERKAESRCGGPCAPLSCGPQDVVGKAGEKNGQCEGLIGSKGEMQKEKTNFETTYENSYFL